MRHLVSAGQFTREEVLSLLEAAERLSCTPLTRSRSPLLANLFFEPSTRTRASFHAAATALGFEVLTVTNEEATSVAKGETLEDTVRTIGQYAKVIVLRHKDQDAAVRAAAVSPVPVVNAGSGCDEHPTQALLDLLTIRRKVGRLTRLNVAITGDLAHSRTVRSLIALLGLFEGVHLHTVSLRGCDLDPREVLTRPHQLAGYSTYPTVRAMVSECKVLDVVYATRPQKERWNCLPSVRMETAALVRWTLPLVEELPKECVVMHPLPRNDEIAPEVDSNPRAIYLTDQLKAGLHVRMAVLNWVYPK